MAYWHWMVIGIALVSLEVFLPSFTALWFGAGALLVGALMLLWPEMTMAVQLLLWSGASVLLTVLWFRYLKPRSRDKTLAGLSREAIVGEVGQVISLPSEHRRGHLRFPAPILGSDEWPFISQDALAVGDRVRVTDVSGNSLMVCKHG